MTEKSSTDPSQYVAWFRSSSPYIHAHRGRTFVVLCSGEAVADPNFPHLVHDIALLHSLGIRLVLVHGARPQIDERLAARGIQTRHEQGLRLTDAAALDAVMDAVGSVRIEIESLLSMGLPNSPMAGARIRVTSGNFVTARPIGVRNGIDFQHTGEVRRIDTDGIRRQLDDGNIVLISPVGYSPTGEVFNLGSEALAGTVAAALRADKLLLLLKEPGVLDEDGELVTQLTPADAENLLRSGRDLPGDLAPHLASAARACKAGVRRAHLLDRHADGALLLELFTRDGSGTLVTSETFEELRTATIEDVGGILELIAPLEAEGVLVRRSRELLEMEIERFTVVERDGAVIGCAALYPFAEEGCGELACVAVHPHYQSAGRGDALLRFTERKARTQKLDRLFVLTTQTAHWFIERGFGPARIDDLPVKRKEMYNLQRNSKVFIKAL